MVAETATRGEMEIIETMERFSAVLRFHGLEARAEVMEQKTEQLRTGIWKRLSVSELREAA